MKFLLAFVMTAMASLLPAEPTGEGSAAHPPAGSPRPEQGSHREARRNLQAIAGAFPTRVNRVTFRDGDWSIQVGGRWFAWAEGRLLPADQRDQWGDYSPVRFYRYYPGPARLRHLSDQQKERLSGGLSSIDSRRPPRNPAFADALYGISSRREAEERMVEISFLGMRTRVHRLAAAALEGVEERILASAEADREVAVFVNQLASVHGYNWRNIAGSGSRSYHSYGMAIDLLPRSYGSRPAYWRWAMEAGYDEWWSIPIEDRWLPPQPVIDAFEAEGFYWGGKWLFFDNLHFEYRPEVFPHPSNSSRDG